MKSITKQFRLTNEERQTILSALRYFCVPPIHSSNGGRTGWVARPEDIALMKKLEGVDKTLWVEK